ncbi:MAG: methyltransferase domain-containing protein [Pirellulaceae bacterium]
MPQFDRDKWNQKYTAGSGPPSAPSAVLLALDAYLPRTGRAIDVGGGAGRHGIWLAQRGLEVTIADVSSVGLALAREAAAAAGVSLQTLEIDLQEAPFPPGPWDLIVSVCYLFRPLFQAYPAALAPGGLLVVVQPTLRNLERHAKPPAPFLLAEGELRTLAGGLEIVHYEEGWLADGRHEACLVARRAALASPSPGGVV